MNFDAGFAGSSAMSRLDLLSGLLSLLSEPIPLWLCHNIRVRFFATSNTPVRVYYILFVVLDHPISWGSFGIFVRQ